MKKMILLLFLLGWSVLATRGQEAKGSPPPLESHPKMGKDEKKAPSTIAKPVSQILGKEVVFGGYLVDLAKSERKRAFFDLKAPLDPKKDIENLIFYPGTEHVEAVILFSIKH
jgi:hypothetical protein